MTQITQLWPFTRVVYKIRLIICHTRGIISPSITEYNELDLFLPVILDYLRRLL
jgi:hypothetical protein